MPEQAGTLKALSKASGLSRGVPVWKERAQQVFDDTFDVLTGALGVPVNSTQSSTLGELVAAALPMIAGTKALRGAAGGVQKGIKAYHGSPHDFDQFSLSKIGTGNGAQARGHGLYFSENKTFAKGYKMAGPEADRQLNQLNARLSQLSKQMEALSPNGYRQWKDPEAGNRLAAEYDALMGQKNKVGKTYEVSINADPDEFLDWDAPLSQQHEKIRQALSGRVKKAIDEEVVSAGGWDDPSGGEAYGASASLMPWSGGPRTDTMQASEMLRQAGVPGIKYIDEPGAAKSVRNYVVFDDKLISIVKKYGIVGALSAGLINQAQADSMRAQWKQ